MLRVLVQCNIRLGSIHTFRFSVVSFLGFVGLLLVLWVVLFTSFFILFCVSFFLGGGGGGGGGAGCCRYILYCSIHCLLFK